MRTIGFFGLRPGRFRHSDYLAGRGQELSNVKHSNLNFIENVQIDHHYAQCITEPFEQHLDKL
jgi:hypothetical protein